jgi:hypothetical protein
VQDCQVEIGFEVLCAVLFHRDFKGRVDLCSSHEVRFERRQRLKRNLFSSGSKIREEVSDFLTTNGRYDT